jgi:hypothetical protein
LAYYYLFVNDYNKCTYQNKIEAIDSFDFKKCESLNTVAPISARGVVNVSCPTNGNASMIGSKRVLANDNPADKSAFASGKAPVDKKT